MTKGRFELDDDGFTKLQQSKPKRFAIRELIANGWDENIKTLVIDTNWKNGVAIITVKDDNPEGFKDLADSFTMFRSTPKMSNPKQRGRFNLGEKQTIAISTFAKIETTKGTVVFRGKNRSITDAHTDTGTIVTVHIEMTEEDSGSGHEKETQHPTWMGYFKHKNRGERGVS